MIAYYNHIFNNEDKLNVTPERHIALITNTDFRNAATKHTTDLDNIKQRITLAEKFLFN